MRAMISRPGGRRPKTLSFFAVLIGALSLFLYFQPVPARLSSWAPPRLVGTFAPRVVSEPGALERYNQASALQEAVADQRIRYYRRTLAGGGMIAYFVVLLDKRVHLEVVNADGATPTSDASGDTIWSDGGQHLATVAEIARAPYAARAKMTLLGAMAFGFHGDVRTSDEGTVVINGIVDRINAGRAALCLTSDGSAEIGLFDATAVRRCEQAIGGGPIMLWRGKIANPDVSAETSEFVPFNPLGEDFVQIDWRKTVYSGLYSKSVVGVGTRQEGGSYLIMLVSYGVSGVELGRHLKAMGCTEALGGDDDRSTQAVWRGAPIHAADARAVPDALAVYLRQ